ncbi:MAG: AlpA family phage regulatory protein [Gammaproteobacteria bacterium]|nr:AlpA family phage regulatory protein [Gammaproteobacteria bacterium]
MTPARIEGSRKQATGRNSGTDLESSGPEHEKEAPTRQRSRETRYIRLGQLASRPEHPGRYQISANTVWRWVREGRFPKPVKLGPGVTAWRLSDLERWEREREAIE